jgi:hypothetical protein
MAAGLNEPTLCRQVHDKSPLGVIYELARLVIVEETFALQPRYSDVMMTCPRAGRHIDWRYDRLRCAVPEVPIPALPV